MQLGWNRKEEGGGRTRTRTKRRPVLYSQFPIPHSVFPNGHEPGLKILLQHRQRPDSVILIPQRARSRLKGSAGVSPAPRFPIPKRPSNPCTTVLRENGLRNL